MSTNKVEDYSKLPSLYMQAKLRYSCHVREPVKLANVMWATISASVQLFISSFLTHFHILMRWHNSSRIRTVGYIIVCLIWRYACCQHHCQGVYHEDGNFGGWSRCMWPLLPCASSPLFSDCTCIGPGTAICRSCCTLQLYLFVSFFQFNWSITVLLY